MRLRWRRRLLIGLRLRGLTTSIVFFERGLLNLAFFSKLLLILLVSNPSHGGLLGAIINTKLEQLLLLFGSQLLGLFHFFFNAE